ncbi:hypothetical protein [Streptomyces roseicoloratus]|uniref:hypothetical protein n=1 Tax=Streptomyces roseicoloratus TaxID=2508722 RepID=UPI001009C438|nr:hypothetical protein [Streptomyces roseicoloratus]
MSSASSADTTRPEQRTEPESRPGRLTAAAAVAGVEGLALVAGGLVMLVTSLTDRSGDLTSALMGAATLVALGLIPLVAARGLWLRRSWSRGPAVITQVLALPVAWQLLQANSVMIPAGIALALLAVTGLVLLASPSTTEALGIKRPGQDKA